MKGEVKEHLKYWWKDPASKFLSCVQGMIVGEKIDPFYIEYVHVCHRGDHRKGKFQLVSKVIIKMINGRCFYNIYFVGNVLCKKDPAVVLKNTLMPAMIVGLNLLHDSQLHIYI